MSDDPVRLRDPASREQDLVRDVLGAGDDFGPTKEGLDRVAARLAVVLPAGTFPPASPAPHATAPIVKLVAALSVVAAVGGGVWLGTTRDVEAPRPAPRVTAPVVAPPSSSAEWTELVPPAPAPSSSASSRPRPAPAHSVALPPSSTSLPTLPTPVAPPPVVEPTPSESEGSMMARAQQALAQRAFADALAITETRSREYPHGTWAEEGERIAIEALVRLGRVDEARQRREQFLRAYPRSAYRERLDALFTR